MRRVSVSRRLVGMGVATFAAVAVAGTSAATATFPGRNGLIAFVSNRHPLLESPQFFAVDVGGGRPEMLTGIAQDAAWGTPSPDGRLVAFTREDGIWLMNADGSGQRLLAPRGSDPVWSPDGSTIAYELGARSLWTVRVDSSEIRLLSLAARNPSWSPSGRQLSFEAGLDSYGDAHGVQVAHADGTNARWLAGEARQPAWSPNGGLIAYSSVRGPPHKRRYGIYVVRPDGTGRRRLDAGSYLPIWASGGARLAYLCDLRPGALCTIDAQGRRRRVVARGVRHEYTDFGKSGALVAAWSRGGLRLAYARGDGIFVVNADGSGGRHVTANKNRAVMGRLSWSRDGGRLLFTQMLAANDLEIYTVSPEGGSVRPLTRNAVADLRPSWAPDGRRLAFMRQRGRAHAFDIWVMNASGREQRLVARNGVLPSWTPDGRRIRFRRGSWTFSVSAAGGNERRLMRALYMSSWSPDGSKLAFLRDRPSGGQYIFLARAGGSGARPLTAVDQTDRLSWSADGTTLAFGSDAFGEERGIYTIQVDGTNERRVATTPYAGSSATFSPDGTSLAFDAGTGYPTSRIEVSAVDGTGRRVVTAARGLNGDPDWQPLQR